MTSALLSPLNVLDERVNRSNTRARSLALNAQQRRGAAVAQSKVAGTIGVSRIKPSLAVPRGAVMSATAASKHNVNRSSSSSAQIMSATAASGSSSAVRKAKYASNMLKEQVTDAEAVIDLLAQQAASSSDSLSKDSDETANDKEEDQKLAGQLSLLDVAVSKPLKPNKALMAEYEFVHKPVRVVALEESAIDDFADWEKIEVETVSPANCALEERRLYSDILNAKSGPAMVAA